MSTITYIVINYYFTNQPFELSENLENPENDILIYKIIKFLESVLYNDKIYLPFPQTKKWFGIFIYYLGTSFLCGYVQVMMQEIYFRVSFIYVLLIRSGVYI